MSELLKKFVREGRIVELHWIKWNQPRLYSRKSDEGQWDTLIAKIE